jgi:hypothetical protein
VRFGLHEVRWERFGISPTDDNIILHGKGNVNYSLRTPFGNNIIRSAVKEPGFVNERIPYIS